MPKLWQINRFVINPHLFNSRDVITLLLGEVPIKKMKAPVEEKEIPEPTPIGSGINITGFSNVKSLEFLSPNKFRPWGNILIADSNKTVLTRGNIIYVNFVEKKVINPGVHSLFLNHLPVLTIP